MEKDWVYSAKFDYIHGRYLAGSIKDWPRLMKQATEYLKPGGWVEMQDFDMVFYTTNGHFKRGCTLDRWTASIASGIESLGMEPHPGHKLKGWMEEAGLINVNEHILPVPLGPWPKDKKLKEIGTANLLQFLDGLEAITLRVFSYVYKWEPQETQIFLAQVRNEMLNRRLQAQHNYHVVYGQKPF